MKKIYLVVGLLAVSPFVYSQRTAVPEISSSTTINFGSPSTRAATDTITGHFAGATPFVYSSNSGFVAGHNDFADKAFMQKITSPSQGVITDLLFWFYAKEGNPASNIIATIWSDASGVPGAVLDTVHIPFSAIDTAVTSYVMIPNAAYNTVATFNTPVSIPAGNVFWAGFSVIYAAGDTVGLFTSTDGDFPNALTETFSQFSDNSFHSFNAPTSWELEVALAVFPVLDLSSGINELKSNSVKLSQNHPNPASKSTVVKYETTGNSMVSLRVFNIAGEEVMHINEGEKAAGKYYLQLEISNLPSGVYYYTFTDGEKYITKKMIVMD